MRVDDFSDAKTLQRKIYTLLDGRFGIFFSTVRIEIEYLESE